VSVTLNTHLEHGKPEPRPVPRLETKLEASEQPPALTGPRRQRNGGIALVTVLAVTVLVLGLLTLISGLTTRSARITRTDAAATAMAQLADGYSDVARVILAENLRVSQLPASTWLDLISANRTVPNPVINPTDPRVVKLAGNHVLTSDGATLGWKIKAVSTASERPSWVQVAATAQDSSGRSQTVLRRVQFAANSIFELAMLADDVNCMFCHLKINGDVGSTNAFRPGWGTESKGGKCLRSDGTENTGSTCGIDSGRNSVIDGSVFTSSSFTEDVTGPNLANGTSITGNKNAKYTGDRLPSVNQIGATAFPGLDRTNAANSTTGTLSGGSIYGVAAGKGWTDKTIQTIDKGSFEGNLVLEGTAADPIRLNGDVYVSGDVVIKGVVSGRGAIYAGRNVYVAGNLVNDNRADKPGAGVCKDFPASSPASPDKCAKANIAAGKDELRIAAGNNIVMGNFTEKDSSGKPLSRRDRQAADYFRDQFGLAHALPLIETKDRFVRKGTGEELRLVSKSGEPDAFIDQLGKNVPAANVKRITGNDVYENLIAPGQTDSAGNFKRWMSDSEYRQILGTEKTDYGLWRTRFRFDKFDKDGKLIEGGLTPAQYDKSTGSVTQKTADLAKELEDAGLPKDISNQVAKKIIENPAGLGASPWKITFNEETINGKKFADTLSFDGSYLRVAMRKPYDYPTEVTQLDAFLYANSRIAGKLGARGGFVNGGLIARELGVLAPGRNGYADWLSELTEVERNKFNFCDRVARPLDSVDDADNDVSNPAAGKCNYAINYDHRLRNGGYGFNLYQGTSGVTADWSFDLTGDQKVSLTP
jgi:hypothetical protein